MRVLVNELVKNENRSSTAIVAKGERALTSVFSNEAVSIFRVEAFTKKRVLRLSDQQALNSILNGPRGNKSRICLHSSGCVRDGFVHSKLLPHSFPLVIPARGARN